MVDRYLLRYFLAVVDQGNFSRAAGHCNVSQPTLSVGIAKLENILGVGLFVRSNQRVELTEAGARFQPYARKIEREFNLAQEAMSGALDRRSLRIGLLETISSDIVAEAVLASRADSDFQLELLFGTERELMGHLDKQRVDLLLTIVDRGGARFVEIPIASEGYSLALSTRHVLSSRQEIAAEELSDETMIVRRHCEVLSDTSRHFLARGVRPRFALRATNDERTLKMVGAGLGLTVMPASHHAPDVVRPRLTGFNVSRTLGWIISANNRHLVTRPPLVIEALTNAIERNLSTSS